MSLQYSRHEVVGYTRCNAFLDLYSSPGWLDSLSSLCDGSIVGGGTMGLLADDDGKRGQCPESRTCAETLELNIEIVSPAVLRPTQRCYNDSHRSHDY